MKPNHSDVEAMVGALFTLLAGLDRARHQKPGAARLSLLQAISDHPEGRPSEIADVLHISASVVTRQVQELEQSGLVAVEPDRVDRRACRLSLTPTGREECARLQQIGIARFEAFVADWEASEVETFTRLLRKLDAAKSQVAPGKKQRAGRPHWTQRGDRHETAGSGDGTG
jgi:DNA-binding MarR family transcriptional regulator